MVDRILSRAGVGLALLFMVLELTYVNAKSLHFMVQGLGVVDSLFGVIGSLAYSMVTVLVMRLGKRKWLKVAFPLFDVALVLCGFNLQHADNLLDNPVRFALSVFLALFTGLITYALGQINAQQHEGQSNADAERLATLTARLNALGLKHDETNRILAETRTKHDETLLKHDETQRNSIELSKKLNETSAKLRETEQLATVWLQNHIRYEAWLAKKRSVTKRNGYETSIEALSERIKAGETVKPAEFFNLTNQ